MSANALIFIVLLFGVLWLLLIRPQRRRQQQQRSMLDRIAPGDEIVTAGGLYGYVRRIDGDRVTVEIAPGTEVRVAKRAVTAVMPPEGADGEEEDEVYEGEEEDEELAEAVAESDARDERRS